MADLKLYDVFDLTPLRDFLRSNGEPRVFSKGECFCRFGTPSQKIGVVNSGGFAFMRPDYKGDNQTCSLAFRDELVGAYISRMPGRVAEFDVCAVCRSEISVMPVDEMIAHISDISPTYGYEFVYAIAYGFMMRAIAYRCESVDARYTELLTRVPDIHRFMSNSAIASYLGVTRETFARMRAKNRSM
ncbi:hypothetical protein [uncultured Muribaculum sp.]|uniref:Crp/Fnr family transcriptional regulator n=1 Tax=uncultured Muribaculum sp. TaxID=1918613 RepID=UPI0025D7AFF9|nr:hypothetical protein [uncultured Muribaculum sp.]